MKYTLGTAAKATGKSKSTIHRAIKSGLISAARFDDGSYEIDPAELHRVFSLVVRNGSVELGVRQSETPKNPVETGLLKQENDFLKQQLEREREFSRELSRRLDEEAEERRKTAEEVRRLTLLLTHQPKPEPVLPSEPQGKGGLWGKFFGTASKK